MHEMSLCEGIVRIVGKQAAKEKVRRVLKIRVAVGDLAGVSAESLLFCFPFAARGTIAEGATLECVSADHRELKVIDLEVI